MGDGLKLPNPWHPMTDPVDVKNLGKLSEEAAELAQVASRCLIQGIDECHPTTGVPNREWLENEIADVRAGMRLAVQRFGLNSKRIEERVQAKKMQLKIWHDMA